MLKVGLIGCGFMGAMHANCYRNIEGVEVVAVADIRPEKAEALAQGATIYGDGMDLIEKADVDIIDICLPTFLHSQFIELCASYGKAVLCEKPFTMTNADAEYAEMIEKIKANL